MCLVKVVKLNENLKVFTSVNQNKKKTPLFRSVLIFYGNCVDSGEIPNGFQHQINYSIKYFNQPLLKQCLLER